MSTRRAIGISAVAQAVTFALSFLNVIVVARLLSPDEIGVYSVAVSFQAIAHVFREFGVNQYLVQAKEVTARQFRAAFSLTLYFSWAIALMLYLAGEPLAHFYRHEGVAAVMALLAVNFVLLPFGTPQLGMLRRELRFGLLAGMRVANAVVTSIVTIGAAWLGQSYLSMAWGALAGHLTNLAVLALTRRGELLMWPTFKGLREVAKFGSGASAVSLINELSLGAPDMVLGKTLGFSSVALYSRAAGLRDMFLSQINTVVNGVHFPTFAQALRRGGDVSGIYCNVVQYLAAVTVPAMALLALLAEPIIRLLFGAQWVPAAPLASVLCATAMVSAPYSLAYLSLMAGGHMRGVLVVTVVLFAARLLALLSSLWWPLDVVVFALILPTLVEATGYQHYLKKAYGVRMRQLWPGLRAALVLALFALALPLALRATPLADAQSGLALLVYVASSVLGAMVGWLTGLAWTNHPLWAEVKQALLSLRHRFG